MIEGTISIKSAKICFKNFSGKEGKFNPAGRRNFCVLLEADLSSKLKRDGWNVRYLEPRDEGDEPQAYMQVAVAFNNFPPRIVMITAGGKSVLSEDDVNILDWADIDNVDLILRPYNWELSGKSGVKAYVKSMYVTLSEDEFESKYYNVPDSAASAMVDIGGR